MGTKRATAVDDLEDEVEEYEEDEVGEVDAEEEEVDEDDDRPAPKIKAKKVKAAEEEEEETESEGAEETSKPVAKKPAKKVSKREEEESPKPKLVKKAVKKGGKETMNKSEKQHRSPRRADWPYGDDSLIGTIFNKAEKTGIALKVARKMCEERKTAKTPSYWVLTDIRRGSWKTAAGMWKWDVDPKALAKGFLKVGNVRLVKLKAKAKAA